MFAVPKSTFLLRIVDGKKIVARRGVKIDISAAEFSYFRRKLDSLEKFQKPAQGGVFIPISNEEYEHLKPRIEEAEMARKSRQTRKTVLPPSKPWV